MLRIEGAVVQFGDLRILDGVDLDLAPGDRRRPGAERIGQDHRRA